MLTDTDRAVLDVEGRFWKYAGLQEAAIGAELDMSATRYYQALHRLMADPAAVAYAPATITRITRITTTRIRTLEGTSR